MDFLRITVTVWMSLNFIFNLIPLLTVELTALECLSHQRLTVHSFLFRSSSFLQVISQDYHKNTDEFEFRPDRTSDSGVSSL